MMAISKIVSLLAFLLALSFLDEAFCMRITKRDVAEGEKDESSELDSTKTGGNAVSDDESELPKGKPVGHEGDDKPEDEDDGDGNPGGEDENPSDDGEKRPSDGGGEEPSDDGEKRPSDGGGEEPSDDGEKRPPNEGDEEPSDDGEKRPPDGGDEEPSDNGGEDKSSDNEEKGLTDEGENGPSDEEVSDGGERRRSTDGGDIGKPRDGKGDGSETTPKNEEDYGMNDGGDDIPKENSPSEDDDLSSSTTNEGESSDKNSTDNAIETISDSDSPFRGGFTFDSPFFNFEQVERYFRKLEDAMESIFQQAILEVGNSTDSFKNSTDKVIVVNGQKYNVHTTIIKGGNENRSISIEAISAVPINDTRKRRSLW